MKLALFSFLLLGISSAVLADIHHTPLTGISDIIAGIIKGVMNSMRDKMPDPITIDQWNISLPYEGIASGNYGISNFAGTGLKAFNVTDVKTNIITSMLTIILTVPTININAKYYQDMLFGSVVPFYGEGPMNIHFVNLTFNLTSHYKLNILKKSLQLSNSTFTTTLEDATFDIHGIINNEAFSIMCSQILDDTVDVFINTHTKLIASILSPIVEAAFNSIMNGGDKVTAENISLAHILSNMNKEDVANIQRLYFQLLKKHPKLAELMIY